jgi:hypothetical protein
MLNMGLGIYWKYTWCIFIPIALLVIFIYAMIVYMPMKTADGQDYPVGVSGIVNKNICKSYFFFFNFFAFAIVSCWMGYRCHRHSTNSWMGSLCSLQTEAYGSPIPWFRKSSWFFLPP